MAALRRSSSCTFADLTTPGYGLRFTSSETADDGREVLDAGWKTMDLLNIGTGETASEGRP